MQKENNSKLNADKVKPNYDKFCIEDVEDFNIADVETFNINDVETDFSKFFDIESMGVVGVKSRV